MQNLRIGIVTQAFFYVPYWLALAEGYYRELGLEVEIADLGGIVEVTRALQSGDIQVGIGSPEHVIHDVEAGGDLRMYGGNVNRLTHSVIVQPEIRSIDQLRGKVIGVSALNAGTSSLFMDLLARHGLGRDDYSIVVAGAVPPRHDLLLQRKIDAAMQTDPHNYMAEDAGLRNLGPISEWIPYFQFTCVAACKSRAEAHRDQLVNFLRGSLRGSRRMFEDRAKAVEVAAVYQAVDRRYLERAWEDHVTGAVPKDLHLDRHSIAKAVELMRRDRSGAYRFDSDGVPARYVELGPLEEAQRAEGVPVTLLA